MQVLYEDNHIIIVNKACGEIVQVDKTGDVSLEETVKSWIKNKYKKPGNVFLGVAHRLDRPVTGVVVFAKTSKSLTRLNQMFKDKTIHKTYWALVKNCPPSTQGTLTNYIRRDQKKNKSFCTKKQEGDSKLAILDYKLIGKSDSYYLLEINLHTGRHHQIRCQLSKIGCPIKGDLKYGFPRSNPNGGISLHAREIKFTHPVSKNLIDVIAPFPETEKIWDKINIL